MPRKTDSNNPADWLFIAESELAGIQSLAEQQLAYTLCTSKLAEVLEKVLKAELLRLGWFLVKTHDLQELAGELQARHSDLLPQLRPLCTALAERYFTDRYPGFDLDDPDWPLLRQQIQQVAAVLAQVKTRVESSSSAPS